MVKPAPKYSLVLLMFILTAAITYWVGLKPVSILFDPKLQSMPTSVGPWTGSDVELDASTKGALDADEVLYRHYANPLTDTEDGLLVVFRKFGRRGFAHRPEMCYPAAGWEIITKNYTTVPYGGKDIQAYRVIAQKDNEREIIVYWFASGRQVEANFVKQQFWMALDRLTTRKYGWAFIRVNSRVTSSDRDTMRQIRAFVGAMSTPLMTTLTGSQAEGVASATNAH